MAKKTRLDLFLGADFQFKFPVLNEAEDGAVNIAGWSLSFMVKRNAADVDADALLTLTSGDSDITIEGTYNADPDVSTQRAVVTVAEAATEALAAGRAAWELKRTDAGFETVLGYGEMRLLRSVHHG